MVMVLLGYIIRDAKNLYFSCDKRVTWIVPQLVHYLRRTRRYARVTEFWMQLTTAALQSFEVALKGRLAYFENLYALAPKQIRKTFQETTAS